MPIATAAKVDALRVDFKSGAALADLLGVSRSRVTRWLKGAGIDPLNAEKVDLLELVWSNLLRIYEPEVARSAQNAPIRSLDSLSLLRLEPPGTAG
jgi:transcriptional regulator with XRE-family HTH domain